MNLDTGRVSPATLLVLSLMGSSTLWGRTLVLSLFVKRAGAEDLPLALLFAGIILMIVSALYNYLDDYIHRSGLFFGLGILLGLLIYTGQAADDLSTIIFLFVASIIFNELFNPRAHQYVAYTFAAHHDREGYIQTLLASRVVQGIASLLLVPLVFLMSAGQLVDLWLLGILMSMVLIIWVSDTSHDQSTPSAFIAEYGDDNPHFQSLGTIGGLVRGRLVRWLTLSALAVSMAGGLLLFLSLDILEAEYRDFRTLVIFFAVVNGLGILASIPLKHVALNRLLQQLNAGRLTGLYAASLNIAALIIVLMPGVFSAGLAELTRTALRTSFYEPIERLLHHALPGGTEGWSQRFIDSYIEPAGYILSAMVIYAAVYLMPEQTLSAVLLGIGMLLLFSAFRAGRYYSHALMASLNSGEYRMLRHTAGEWGPSDMTSIERLIETLSAIPLNSRRSLMLAEVIAESHIDHGYEVLCQRLHQSPPDIQAELLPIIVGGWFEKSRLSSNQALVDDALTSQDPALRRAALKLISTYPELTADYKVARMLVDDDPIVNIMSASVLMRHPSQQVCQAARSQLRWLARHREVTVRVSAVEALVEGSINAFGEVVQPIDVEPFLQDPATRVREAALGAASLDHQIGALCDPAANVRHTALHYVKDRRFEGARITLRKHLSELRTIEALSPHIQIEHTICRWRLLAALAHLKLRYRKNSITLNLQAGFEKLDMLAAMAMALQSLGFSQLKPVVRQLQVDYKLLLNAMCEFLIVATWQQHMKGVLWTLENATDEKQRKIARHALASATDSTIADAFERALQHPPVMSMLDTPLPRPRAVLRVLLSQDDDWRPLIALYAIMHLPDEQRQWLDYDLAKALLEERLRSPVPAIREATRLIRQYVTEREHVRHLHTKRVAVEENEGVVMLSILERMIFLRNVSFFGDLRIDQLRALARVCDEIAVAKGKRIIRQGDVGEGLFIVVEGRVSIERDAQSSQGRITLFEMGPAEVFGEISLLDGGVRTADVIAQTPVLLLGIKREALDEALEDDPSIAMGMLRAMAQRVRRSTEVIDKQVLSEVRDTHEGNHPVD